MTATGMSGAPSPLLPGPGVLRASLREVREVAYRAMIAHGACPGRAPAAAEQVLEAELHHGAGFAGLLADLALGPWDAGGLDLRRAPGDLLLLDSPDAASPLRVGQLVTDLASVAGPVHVPALCDPWPLMAGALLGAAAGPGCALGLLRAGSSEAWVATPEGALVSVVLSGWSSPDRGSLVAVFDPPAARAVAESVAERRRRRRAAARDGLLVDAATFASAYDASRAYLVPET